MWIGLGTVLLLTKYASADKQAQIYTRFVFARTAVSVPASPSGLAGFHERSFDDASG